MFTRHRQEVTATCSHANKMQPPIQDPVDGQTTLESSSDARNQHYTTQRHPLASKVEQAPRDQIPYKDLVLTMKEQVEQI